MRHFNGRVYGSWLLMGLAWLLAAPRAAADDNDSALTSHRILVKVGSVNISQKDFDEMGEVMFTLYFPNRKLNEITPQELEQLNPLALKELIIILLAEDETKLLTGKDAVKISSADIARSMQSYHIDRLYNNRVARRYASAQLAINQMLRQYVTKPTPSPREVQQFYQQNRDKVFTTARQVKVRHIFLHAEDSDPAVERRALRIYEDLKELAPDKRSEPFQRAARDFSEDRFKQNNGMILVSGEDGWFIQDSNFKLPDGSALFPEPMLEGISVLRSPGDIELRKSERGWHILLLEDIKGGTTLEYPRVRRLIEDYLSNQAMEDGREKWLLDKTKRTLITWNDGTAFPLDRVTGGASEAQRLEIFHQYVIRAAGN